MGKNNIGKKIFNNLTNCQKNNSFRFWVKKLSFSFEQLFKNLGTADNSISRGKKFKEKICEFDKQ